MNFELYTQIMCMCTHIILLFRYMCTLHTHTHTHTHILTHSLTQYYSILYPVHTDHSTKDRKQPVCQGIQITFLTLPNKKPSKVNNNMLCQIFIRKFYYAIVVCVLIGLHFVPPVATLRRIVACSRHGSLSILRLTTDKNHNW